MSFDIRHSPSNAHTYRLLVVKELGFSAPAGLPSATAILTCFNNLVNRLLFSLFALAFRFALLASSLTLWHVTKTV